MFVGFCQSGSNLHMMRIFKMSADISVIHIIKNDVLYVICRSFILCLNIFKVRKNWQSIFQKEKTYLLIVSQQNCQKYFVINVWRKSVFDICFTEFGAALKTVLPVLFKYCHKYCYSDSRRLWVAMEGGGLAL
jgi:hypothetical protein